MISISNLDFLPTHSDQLLFLLLDATLKGSIVLLLTRLLLLFHKKISTHSRSRIQFFALLSSGVLMLASLSLYPELFDDSNSNEGAACMEFQNHNETKTQNRGQLASYTFQAVGKFKDDSYGQETTASKKTAIPNHLFAGGSSGWLLMIWLTGTVACLVRLPIRLLGLLQWVRRAKTVGDPAMISELQSVSRELGITRRVKLLTSRDVPVPMIWGPPVPFVVIPDSLECSSREEIRMILLHELAHLQDRDAISAMIAEIICSIFWFNPLVWKERRNLQGAQEISADSSVIAKGVKPSDYSRLLMDLIRSRKPEAKPFVAAPGAHAILGKRLLDSRLSSVLSPETPHARPSRWATRFIGLSFLLTVAGLASLETGIAEGKGFGKKASFFSFSSKQGVELVDSLLSPSELHRIVNPVFVNKMADFYIAGAAISIVKDGQIVYTGGYGKAEIFNDVPVVAERTIFRIGSVTKVVTAVALLQLVDHGLVNLEADVNEYLTDFKIDDTFAEPVRVKHLLTHTAGFDQLGYGRHVTARDEVLPLGDFLRENLVRIRPPGEVSAYDTYAITLAGYLVEQISGQSYEQYIEANIFEPLEMHRTNIVVPKALESDVAVGYEFRGEWLPQQWEFMNTDPASTVNSTVTDMANFMTMLLQKGAFRDRRILSEKSTAEMLKLQYTNHPEVEGYSYLLWQSKKYGVDMFRHGGSMTGYACSMNLIPQHNLGIFIAYNQESGRMVNLVLSALIDTLLPGSKAMRAVRKPRLKTPVDVTRFTGRYANNVYNHSQPEAGGWRLRPFELKADENGVLLFDDGPCYLVGDLLFQRDDGLILAFRENDQGEISHLFVRQTVYEKLP